MTCFPRNSVASGVFLLLALAGCGSDSPATGDDPNARARAVLDRVVDSTGGLDSLQAVGTLVAHYAFSQFFPTEPGAPDSVTVAEVLQARDFVNGRSLYEFHIAATPETWERVVMAPDGAFRVNLLTHATQRFPTPAQALAQYADLQLRWYIHQAILEARLAATLLRRLPDTTMDGVPRQVITWPGSDSEILLYVDPVTGRITDRIWRFDAPTGARQIHMRFGDYERVGGYWMPMVITLLDDGRVAARYDIRDLRINAPLNPSAFALPGGP